MAKPSTHAEMRVLITGDGGFVGNATRRLLAQRMGIVGYDLMDGFDIRDRDQLASVVEATRPSRILHLAAIARFADADRDPLLTFETNVDGTRNVVDVAKLYHVPLVYASTGSVYMPIEREPPITEDFPIRGNSVYGCTKALGEFYVRQHTPHIILRYAHLYGKEKRGHGLVSGFVQRIERGLSPTLYGGKQSNDFTYVDDVAQANKLALEAPWDVWNRAYNIGTGEELTAERAARLICGVLGYDWSRVQMVEQRTVDPQRFVYDISKAKRMLGYQPKFNFAQGLAAMLQTETYP